MPRSARKKSSNGIYHIILRGINQQIIFEDRSDYSYFIKSLETVKERSNCTIYTYCLMNNHVHILLKENDEPLEIILRRLCSKYVYWYNHKYNRVGHLFQERFKSEPIENEQYLLTVFRYILQNPVKAGIVSKISDHPWTNYSTYTGESDSFTDTSFILSFFPKKEVCLLFLNSQSNDSCLDLIPKQHKFVCDEQALDRIKKLSHCSNSSDFQSLSLNERKLYIHTLKEEGLSIRQISRLTGVSKSLVEKA